jgi:four helix bundle protein
MKEPSDKRKRTLALQERAIRFSVAVDAGCPATFLNYPSQVVWEQLVRAAESTSNNLIEAEDASSDADFLHKMRTALREAKESKACLRKLRLAQLQNAAKVSQCEQEADELAAIFATILKNTELRLQREGKMPLRKGYR